ncbi:MAG: cytochrome c [Pseudomonadota bacterium]
MLSPAATFAETGGGALYANICQGCHMADGKGAAGAGSYPPLAGDTNLQTAAYVLYVVINGSKAMPPVGAMMSDTQVADVINFVRSHFGNSYPDAVTVDDVRAARPAAK